MSWLVAQRIDASLELLEVGGRGVEEVASAVGFQTAASYRKHFRRVMAVSPTQYRRGFQAGG